MALSPMMQSYLQTKEEYKDCFLFYRLGDFYELFFDDAIECSKLLELTLTGKSCGLEERAPMCGVPFHAADNYIDKLVKDGYKVAICEQVEDPKTAKGLVKREVIRVATPGTNLNTLSLDESKNNFLMSVVYTVNAIGVSYVDVTTGDFFVTEFDSISKLLDEIYKIMPSEIICNDSFLVSGIDLDSLKNKENIIVSALDSWYFDDETAKNTLLTHFNLKSLKGIGIDDFTIGVVAAGAAMQYLLETQKISLEHISSITPYISSNYMLIDRSTRRNLELCETMRDKEKKGSLFWVLDKTKTAMGARTLRNAIEQPLIDKALIEKRLASVSELFNDPFNREELREYLSPIYDLERLISRISYKTANPRDLIALKKSLEMLPIIKNLLNDFKSEGLIEINNSIDGLNDMFKVIDEAIIEEPPVSVRDGGILKSGYNEEVDKLRNAGKEGKNWLAEELEKEKEKSGIKSLKLKYNKVFGYYLEVTNSFKDLVPEEWIRKQTLVNAERYTTPKLKELEDTILGAADRLNDLEYTLYSDILSILYDNIGRIQKTAKEIAKLDMFASLATVAEKNHYVCPEMSDDGVIKLKHARHPVVEKMIPNGQFIDNDTFLDKERHRISIITGPNMAGKSTYMRQTALIVLMAQIGSFVPAESAHIGIVDRIFTRVGASDDLSSGQSTFMVEMTEVANILRNATSDSLIILDEIGRGTSTFDGLSIAWAVVEYIADPNYIGAKTLFATHYHELTELEGKLDSVNNYCIAVKEQGEDIIFLRKIIKGGADKSYGIQVARLAGVPKKVLDRAFEIVDQLVDNDLLQKAKEIEVQGSNTSLLEGKSVEKKDNSKVDFNGNAVKNKNLDKDKDNGQITLFDMLSGDNEKSTQRVGGNESAEDKKNLKVIKSIKNADLSRMTPIDALNLLYKLQNQL